MISGYYSMLFVLFHFKPTVYFVHETSHWADPYMAIPALFTEIQL